MPFISSVERIGIRKGLLLGIEASLRIRFGPEGLQLLPQIQNLTDVERLKAILEALTEPATTVDEIRRLCS
jgi:hypothetical protein